MSDLLHEFRELCTFIDHANPQVRLQAAKMVSSLSASAENRKLIAQTKLVQQLAKHMTDAKEISREVYKGLINCAEDEELHSQMLQRSFMSIAMECMRDSKTDNELRELILMFLVNMSRDEKGASLLMQEGEEIEGLHVRRLFNWFVGSQAATSANTMDPYAYIAHLLTNVTQITCGRRLLMNRTGSTSYIAALIPQLQAAAAAVEAASSPSAALPPSANAAPNTISTSVNLRRLGLFQCLKNLFMEPENHAMLLDPKLGLWPELVRPIVGDEDFLHGESEYEGLDPRIRAMQRAGKRREADPQLRCLVYEIILLCAKQKPSRVQLRSSAIYPLLRHAHDEEKELSKRGDGAARELDELVEQIVPFFILDEDDANHPDKKDEEKKKQRIEQLKKLNETEPVKKREAETIVEDGQAVHYLGDELGGEVRKKQQEAASKANSAQPVSASSVAPESRDHKHADEDEDFPSMEPITAEETERLGEVTHNIQSLELAKKSKAAEADDNNQQQTVTYAQAAADEEEEDDDDEPPPLADESNYMDAMD